MRNKCIILLLCITTSLPAIDGVRLANGEYPPLTSQNLMEYGFFSQIVTEAFKAVGIEVEYQFLPWLRGWNMVKIGDLDGSLAYIKTEEREEFALFSHAVWSGDKSVAFYLKEMEPVLNRVLDLARYRVIIQRGHSYGEKVDSLISDGVLTCIYVESEEQAFKLLLKKRADLFLTSDILGLKSLDESFILQKSLFSYSTYDTNMDFYDYYLVISRERQDGKKLIEQFNRGLKQIKDSGLYDSITP